MAISVRKVKHCAKNAQPVPFVSRVPNNQLNARLGLTQQRKHLLVHHAQPVITALKNHRHLWSVMEVNTLLRENFSALNALQAFIVRLVAARSL
jgi:hypothetical protein